MIVAALLLIPGKPGAPSPIPLRRPAATACAEHWVGSWSASPSGVSLTQPLADQTLRMIIAPHLGGSILRVHLSNRFGRAPVTLGPVTVGLAGSGASLVAGSERAVTFRGSSSVTIPVGAEALSDPVSLRFGAFRDLAISVYVPGLVADPDEHLSTRQTSYLSPRGSGDHAAQGSPTAFSRKTTQVFSTGWYFLDGVDVTAPGATGAVVAFGDSITDGYQAKRSGLEQLSTIDTNGRYPDDLERRLIAAKIPLSVLNAGIGANQLLHSALPVAGPSGLSRFAADALAQAGVRDVIVLEGINDIAARAGASKLIAAYEELISRAHAAGVAIQLGTLTPTGGAASPAYAVAAATSVRQQVNHWIRSQRFSDGIVDFDASVRDPHDPNAITPAYDGGDGVHLDLAGYRAMASAVNLRTLARPNCIPAQRP
ncbi:MAG TPA: GDSL-type esterase/lipase family protein [Solirubrobacteraceae bacterium]